LGCWLSGFQKKSKDSLAKTAASKTEEQTESTKQDEAHHFSIVGFD